MDGGERGDSSTIHTTRGADAEEKGKEGGENELELLTLSLPTLLHAGYGVVPAATTG